MSRRTLAPLFFAGLVGLAACGSSSAPANQPTTTVDAMKDKKTDTTAMADKKTDTTAMQDKTATTAKP